MRRKLKLGLSDLPKRNHRLSDEDPVSDVPSADERPRAISNSNSPQSRIDQIPQLISLKSKNLRIRGALTKEFADDFDPI